MPASIRRSSTFGQCRLSQERVGQARFALVEAFGMERLLEREKLVVEMMAKLMDQRTQERTECNDLMPLRGAHPYRDPRRRIAVLGLVETMQLAIIASWPFGENANAYRRHVIALCEGVDQNLGAPPHGGPVLVTQ